MNNHSILAFQTNDSPRFTEPLKTSTALKNSSFATAQASLSILRPQTTTPGDNIPRPSFPTCPTNSWHILRSLVFGLLCFVGGFGSWIAHAQTASSSQKRAGDYDPTSNSWNGMSGFAAQAAELGIRLETPQIWDWKRADIRVPIFIISPVDDELTLKPLMQFINAGGRVFVADDFGAGTRILYALGANPYRTGIHADRWDPSQDIDLHRTIPHPYQEPNFLLRQASFLFLNVPQWLSIVEAERRGLHVEVLLTSRAYRSSMHDKKLSGNVLVRIYAGAGTVLLCSDPSLLINQMVVYGDNKRFVKNLLRYMTTPVRSKRIVLLWGRFVWHSQPPKTIESLWQSTQTHLWEAALSTNQSVTSLPALYSVYPPFWEKKKKKQNHPVARSTSRAEAQKQFYLYPFLTKGTLIGVFFLTWLGWLFFYLPSPGKLHQYDASHEENQHTISSRFESQLENYRDGMVSYIWPAILLREELVVFLAEHFGFGNLLRARNPNDWGPVLLQLLENRTREPAAPPELIKVLPRLRALLAEIPSRHNWRTSIDEQDVKAATLHRHYDETMLCLSILRLKDSFRDPFVKQQNENSPSHSNVQTT